MKKGGEITGKMKRIGKISKPNKNWNPNPNQNFLFEILKNKKRKSIESSNKKKKD